MNFNIPNLGLPASTKGLNANTYNAFTSGLDNSGTMWKQSQEALQQGDAIGQDAAGMYRQMAETKPGTLADTDLSGYMNKFTSGVINPLMDEMNRQEALQQRQVEASAQAQGAFGGDRMQIQKAAMNRDFDVTRKTALADLYRQAFDNAQGAAKFDITGAQNREAAGVGGLAGIGGGYLQHGANMGNDAQGGLNSWANMGFGWGTDLQDQQLAAGGLQQQQQQQIMDAIKKQFAGATGYPDTAIARITGGTPSPGSSGTTTETKSPSLAGTLLSILGF